MMNGKLYIAVAVLLFQLVYGGLLYAQGRAAGRDAGVKACVKTLTRQCQAEKALTTEISREYQNKITLLDRRYAELKRLRNDKCLPLSGPAAGHDARAGTGKPAGGGGVDPGRIVDLGYKAETYRQRLIACQSYVDRLWTGSSPE